MWVVPLLPQRITLLYTETVLLINNDQTQSLKVHIFLDQCVCPDGYRGLTILQGSASQRAFTLTQTACKKHSAYTKGFQHRANAARVLFGEQFGGGHDGALVPVECRHEQSGGGYCCLASSNVTLQEAAHRPALSQVREDFADDTPLCRGEREGEGCFKWLVSGNRRPER